MTYPTAPGGLYLLALFFGLSVGSFLNVVIFRLPRENLSLTKPGRSFCPACGAQISWFDNIPLLSWLWLRARCRSCAKPIAARYPLVELMTGLMSVYLFHVFGLSTAYLFYFYFFCCLLSIALIDLELMIIPMSLVYPTIALGLVSAFVHPSVELAGFGLWTRLAPDCGPHVASLAGALGGLALGWGALAGVSLAYKLVRGHEGMGDGDPPLLGMIGVFLGWRSILMVILWSTLIGILSAGLLIWFSKGRPPEEGWGRKALPFGPFLVLGALLYLFFGPEFLAWYWGLLGGQPTWM
ncbi:MAG: prepilin peptidase [Candidatus Adiutrix sp.]|jgi:leader peptidase (prepilin peptidase)/N-methyltransferase|nr:prepilin peptidase [Candidatus Adiutrix sp.]